MPSPYDPAPGDDADPRPPPRAHNGTAADGGPGIAAAMPLAARGPIGSPGGSGTAAGPPRHGAGSASPDGPGTAGPTAGVEGLAGRMVREGGLDAAWWPALVRARREAFIPDVAWAVPDRPDVEGYPIDRDARPDEWREAVYSDTVIATQADDGAGDVASGRGEWTSSCSAPDIVAAFLGHLGVMDGHRVLEIGTGTGWTAGLLAARLGDERVTSVEVDPAIAACAARSLKAAGFTPTLVVGDGGAGLPDGAPYDRVHVGCGVERVPHAWVEQCRRGGAIVFPWSPGHGAGHLARLAVTGDGRAIGGLYGPAGFMMLRGQRRPRADPAGLAYEADTAERTLTRLDPRAVAWDSPGADVAIGALVPGVRSHMISGEAGRWTLWLLENRPAGEASWAAVEYEPDRPDYAVAQRGERRLWDEAAGAYLRWLSWGRPDRSRFGLTVDPDGQRVWLDRPDAVITK